MRRSFSIVHILPDKTEHVIAVVTNYKEVAYYVEEPRYVGTWITSTRKLLRYGRGEIQVREVVEPMRIASELTTMINKQLTCILTIENGEGLTALYLRANEIIGVNHNGIAMWTASSFPELAELVNKEFAYNCLQCYEKFIEANGLTGIL